MSATGVNSAGGPEAPSPPAAVSVAAPNGAAHFFSPDILVKSFVAGGIAGMVAKTAVAPLDRIKILFEAQKTQYKNLSVYSGLCRIKNVEGFSALYKGNTAQMVRIFPYSAIQFTSFEIYKWLLSHAFHIGPDSHLHKFVAGSLAGLSSVTFTFPLDLIRARMAFQNEGENRYHGILQTGRKIYAEEGGFRGLFRGIVPSWVGMIPYAGLAFYCFELCKFVCIKEFPKYTCHYETKDGQPRLLVSASLIAGGMAGAMAQTFSYPVDVTRRRMQLALMYPETNKFAHGMVSSLLLIYREDGVVRGLYRGLSINYLRAVPMAAISFATNEAFKQLFGVPARS